MAVQIPPPFTGPKTDVNGNATYEWTQFQNQLGDLCNSTADAYTTAAATTISKKNDWQDALDTAYNAVHHTVVDPVMNPIRAQNKQGAQNAFSFWLTTCAVPPTSAERKDKRVYFNGQAKTYTQSTWQSNYTYFVSNKLSLATQDPSVITAYTDYLAASADEYAKHLDWSNASYAMNHHVAPAGQSAPYPPFPTYGWQQASNP